MLPAGSGCPASLTAVWRHVRAIGVLPGLGVIGIPALTLVLTDFEAGWGLDGALQALPVVLGVRNPMIVGVLLVVLGEAALFGSPALLVWGAVFFALNAV